MSSKTSAQVIIGGRVYTLSGYEEEAYLQKVASYLNGKLEEFKEMPDYTKLSGDMKSVLLELNIADDYFKAKAQVERLERELQQKEDESSDLKNELVSRQIEQERNTKAYEELEAENRRLLLEKTKLEAALEQNVATENKEEKEYNKKGTENDVCLFLCYGDNYEKTGTFGSCGIAYNIKGGGKRRGGCGLSRRRDVWGESLCQ